MAFFFILEYKRHFVTVAFSSQITSWSEIKKTIKNGGVVVMSVNKGQSRCSFVGTLEKKMKSTFIESGGEN